MRAPWFYTSVRMQAAVLNKLANWWMDYLAPVTKEQVAVFRAVLEVLTLKMWAKFDMYNNQRRTV